MLRQQLLRIAKLATDGALELHCDDRCRDTCIFCFHLSFCATTATAFGLNHIRMHSITMISDSISIRDLDKVTASLRTAKLAQLVGSSEVSDQLAT